MDRGAPLADIRHAALPAGLLGRLRSSRRMEEEAARNIPRLAQALEEEKREGHRIAIRMRTIALLVTSVLVVIANPRIEVIYYQAFLLLYIILGYVQLRAARVGQSRLELALIFVDLALLAFLAAVPNPFAADELPTAMQFRFDVFPYFFVFLAAGTLAYSWRTVQTIGVWAALLWFIAVGYVWWFGRTDPEMGTAFQSALSDFPRVFEILDPNSIEFANRLQEGVLIILVGGILGLKARRSADLLVRQATMAAERANLSRYFPPNLVDELAARSEPMGSERAQDVAVLFADIVGFTRMAESSTPLAVIALLRDYHAVLEDAVFSHGGTLDKYLGDGIMASFGTPNVSPDDAANALAAAFAMHEGVDRVNRARQETGLPEIRLSVGIHYGQVVLGDIGSARRMEFAMLGDTVNVASRLESTTRESDCRIVASDSVIRAIADPDLRQAFENRLQLRHGRKLRGRSEILDVWEA